MKRPVLLLAIVLLAAACDRRSTASDELAQVVKVELAQPEAPDPPAPTCASRIAAVREAPSLPGTPGLDAERASLLAAVKAEPVVFVAPPAPSDSDRSGAAVLRALLRRTKHPADVVRSWLPLFRGNPQLGREVLLRDGYLYAESIEQGRALVEWVLIEHVASAPRVRIERGAGGFDAVRDKRTRRYVYADGPEQGRQVSLVLFDRVVEEGSEPTPALHRDLRELRMRLGFERASVRHATDTTVVAALRYGELEVTSLLQSEGARLGLVCEDVEPGQQARLEELREQGLGREAVLARIRSVVVEQVQEALPFDEPRKEFGQQDGVLRDAWRRAYQRGAASYKVNGDDYAVFDQHGRPAVPQVCLDFLIDTMERAAGAWWTGRDEPRARTEGSLDMAALGMGRSRSIEAFLAFARARPEWFDVLAVPLGEQVSFKHEKAFLQYLSDQRDDFQPGDMVIIRGYLPKPKNRKREQHYHSFFIYENDPASGVPALIAGNAGRPRITTWLREMRRTPQRAIQYRVRFSTSWLAEHLKASEDWQARPAPIAPGAQQG